MYALISSISWLLLFWKLPETRGRSLEDISCLFAKTKQPDDQDMMDDETSANQSSVGGGAGGVGGLTGGRSAMVFNQLGSTGQHNRPGNVLCHDNLAFAADSMGAFQMGGKGVSQVSTADTAPVVERSKSFKLDNPLTKAASMALSQPDLQLHQQSVMTRNNNNHQQPQQCPPTSAVLSSLISSAPTTTAGGCLSQLQDPQQQQHHHNQTQQQDQQHLNQARKYSDQHQHQQQASRISSTVRYQLD
jgi:hypothetical protein